MHESPVCARSLVSSPSQVLARIACDLRDCESRSVATMWNICSVLAVLCGVFEVVHGEFGPHSDLITSLPGLQSTLPFKQYSGYATVDAANGRNLFYWFVESQSSPSDDPLVLWLNGGPGCSSLGGLTSENGPFQPTRNGSLDMNEFSWNKAANVIYLESPSGVGFSYSNTKSDYDNPGDASTAKDVVTFLVEFLKAYDQFKGRDFFISGESYGGHYVPTTAKAIVEHNSANPGEAINLKGILIGNAWTVAGDDNLGVVQTWLGYNLVREASGNDVVKYCNLSNMLPILEERMGVRLGLDLLAEGEVASEAQCQAALAQVSRETGNIDPYDIYQLMCLEDAPRHRTAFLQKMADSDAPLRFHARNALRRMQLEANGPCQMEHSQAYLNMKTVQDAIHAKPTRWSECNMQINANYSRVDFLASMIPVHQYLLKSGIRTVVYSGDIDGIVPTHGTRNWIARLVATGAIAVTKPWRPWADSATQVGGFVTNYGAQFSFITVHGAGHMVPSTQPLRALDVLTRFLKNTI